MAPPVARPPRLLFVSEPGRDGVFEHVARLSDHLHRLRPGITVDLAYSSRRAGPGLEPLVARIRERGGVALDLGVGNGPEPGDFRALSLLAALVRERRPGVVHAHSSKAGVLARALAAVTPGFPPVVYSPHAYYGLGGGRSARTRLYNMVEAVLGRVGTTINCSSDERRFALRTLGIPRRRLVLVDTGIDTERFHPATPEEREAARAAFGLAPGEIALISLGRVSAQKNYGPLYRGLEPLLAAPGSRLRFVHVGAGAAALAAALRPEARARVTTLDYADRIEPLFAAADAFVMTSRYEGLSAAVLQALATGAKTFLTRVPGMECLARSGLNEIAWLPWREGDALASEVEAALGTWLADPRPPSPGQVARTRERFTESVQFGKVFRLHAKLARWD